MRILKTLLLTSALLLAISASAKSYVKTKYVKVTKRYKVTKWRTKQVPYQSCYYESVPVQYTDYVDEYRDNPGATVAGGALGGVVGHQFGSGRGRDVATVVGAIAGSMIANKHSKQHYRRPVTRTRYEQRRVCNTYYKTKRYRVTRWKNIGYNHGRKIVKLSKYRLKRIPLKIRVSY